MSRPLDWSPGLLQKILLLCAEKKCIVKDGPSFVLFCRPTDEALEEVRNTGRFPTDGQDDHFHGRNVYALVAVGSMPSLLRAARKAQNQVQPGGVLAWHEQEGYRSVGRRRWQD